MDRTTVLALVSALGTVLAAVIGVAAVRDPLPRRRLAGLAALILVTTLVVSWLLWDRSERIDTPVEGAVVAQELEVRGAVAPLTSEPAYLVVADGEAGRYYPQHGALATDPFGRFEQRVFLGDVRAAGRGFELLLVRADTAGADALDRYLADAVVAGSWPGLETLPAGVRVLDVVRVVRHDAGHG
jgi:hypothetical protein